VIPFRLSKDISFELPQDYGELTLKQFFELRKKADGDFLDLLSILSNLPKSTWEQAKDFNIDVKIAPYLDWMNEKFNPESFVLSDSLIINGKECKRPKDIRTQTNGQKLALEKQHYKNQESGGTDVDLIPFALANYLQPIYFNNKYDSDQVDELLPLVMECKIQDAYPIGSFFLNSYARLLTSKERYFLMFLHQKKYELELNASKNSKSSERYTLLQRVLISLTTILSKWTITLFSLRYGMRKNRQIIKES
jgi:hypothetical protein